MDKLTEETNEKFVQRVLSMVYSTCGCDKERGILVLKDALKRARRLK